MAGVITYALYRSQFTSCLLPPVKTEISGFEAEPGTKIKARQACANLLHPAKKQIRNAASRTLTPAHAPIYSLSLRELALCMAVCLFMSCFVTLAMSWEDFKILAVMYFGAALIVLFFK